MYFVVVRFTPWLCRHERSGNFRNELTTHPPRPPVRETATSQKTPACPCHLCLSIVRTTFFYRCMRCPVGPSSYQSGRSVKAPQCIWGWLEQARKLHSAWARLSFVHTSRNNRGATTPNRALCCLKQPNYREIGPWTRRQRPSAHPDGPKRSRKSPKRVVPGHRTKVAGSEHFSYRCNGRGSCYRRFLSKKTTPLSFVRFTA